MYLTEKEIMSQTEALKKTSSYFEKNREKISDFFTETGREKFVFMGCGSSFMLCKSLEHIFKGFGFNLLIFFFFLARLPTPIITSGDKVVKKKVSVLDSVGVK